MPILSLNRRQDKRGSDREGASYGNPWKEIEGTVRKVDEEKVKDCTDDIDTLLVFAGLYSAVLTAFLIESYKNLFADESETLLRQMVLQSASYNFTNGYLNSTFDPSQLPTFKAAVSDIRVNVCWFASLILSLSSASFGIAVKQWLREFLAMDYISPQERLRIRDVRIHGLADWKLFQIAAFLPILLQVSLMLFFVGLCFFTAAVHRSIGITSLFLVSCWAFLFFMSVLAPLFSPRCPYKTTILKVPFRYARPRVRAFLQLVYQRVAAPHAHLRRARSTTAEDFQSVSDSADFANSSSESLHAHPLAPLTAPLKSTWLRLRTVFAFAIKWICFARSTFVSDEHAGAPNPYSDADPGDTFASESVQWGLPVSSTSSLRETSATNGLEIQSPPDSPCTSAWPRFAAFPRHLLRRLRGRTLRNTSPTKPADIASEDTHDTSKELQYYDDYVDLGILGKLSSYVVPEDTVSEEEDMIRSMDTKDLHIFSNIDVAFCDDNLLTWMPQALSQHLPLLDIARFVTTVVWHRLGSSHPTPEKSRRREWPWTLSPRARVALVDMLVESMEHELLRGTPLDWETLSSLDSEWSLSFTLLILLQPSRETIPSSVTRLFESFIDYRSKRRLWANLYDVFAYQVRSLAQVDPDWPARSLLFLARGITTLKTEDAEDCLRQVIQAIFVKPELPPTENTYRVLLERKPHDYYDDGDAITPTPETLVALLEVARVILHNVTLEQTEEVKFHETISVLLAFVFDAIPSIKKSLSNVTFDKPVTPASDGPGLYCVLTDLFTMPHMTRRLLHFFVIYPRFLSPLSQIDGQWFFLGLIEHALYPTRDSRIAVLAACTEFFMIQATSASSMVDSPATLLHLSLLVYHFSTSGIAEFIVCWQKLFAAVHECYKRINQIEPHSEPSMITCRYLNSHDQHTNTCETAYAILNLRERWIADYKFPDEMINFVRTFVCPAHTLNKKGGKLNLIERLEQAERTQAEVAASKQSLSNVVEESEMGPARAGTGGSPVVPARIDSVDDYPREERSAGPSDASTLRGLVDFSIGDVVFSSLPTPADESAPASPGGHDTDSPVLEQSDPSLAHDTGTDPQDNPGITTSDDMIRSLLADAQGSPVLAISRDTLAILPAGAPNILQAVEHRTASPDDLSIAPESSELGPLVLTVTYGFSDNTFGTGGDVESPPTSREVLGQD